MEQLHNGFTLTLCDGAFPLSTDSVALSGFVRLPKTPRYWIWVPAAVHWGFCCALTTLTAM